MEDSSSKKIQDDIERSTKDEGTPDLDKRMDIDDRQGYQGNKVHTEGDKNVSPNMDSLADINMEAFISSDDVIRAGGFGARDDLNTVLPVAIDMTDFEASLRDARDYEDPQEKINRPGLGWSETK